MPATRSLAIHGNDRVRQTAPVDPSRVDFAGLHISRTTGNIDETLGAFVSVMTQQPQTIPAARISANHRVENRHHYNILYFI
jgi:hypothetical protein